MAALTALNGRRIHEDDLQDAVLRALPRQQEIKNLIAYIARPAFHARVRRLSQARGTRPIPRTCVHPSLSPEKLIRCAKKSALQSTPVLLRFRRDSAVSLRCGTLTAAHPASLPSNPKAAPHLRFMAHLFSEPCQMPPAIVSELEPCVTTPQSKGLNLTNLSRNNFLLAAKYGLC